MFSEVGAIRQTRDELLGDSVAPFLAQNCQVPGVEVKSSQVLVSAKHTKMCDIGKIKRVRPLFMYVDDQKVNVPKVLNPIAHSVETYRTDRTVNPSVHELAISHIPRPLRLHW